MGRRLGCRLQGHRLRAIVGHGVVSTGAQTPASFGFQSPGDYATCNSNHTPDGTLSPAVALKPNPANARIHSKKQIRQIANSIEAFGFNVPVLVDAELKVIAGHGRLLACRELGWTEVPTLCLDHLTPAQARAFT